VTVFEKVFGELGEARAWKDGEAGVGSPLLHL